MATPQMMSMSKTSMEVFGTPVHATRESSNLRIGSQEGFNDGDSGGLCRIIEMIWTERAPMLYHYKCKMLSKTK